MVRVKKLHKKNVLFIGGPSGRDELMFTLADELKKTLDVVPSFISFAKGGDDYYQSKSVPRSQYSAILPDEQPVAPKIDTAFLRQREDLYGIKLFDLWQIAAPRKKKRLKMSAKEILGRMEYTIKKLEKHIATVTPDYAVITGIAGYMYVIAYKILLQKNIPVLELTNARLPGKFTFDNQLRSEWPLVLKRYNEIKRRGLKPKERDEALGLVNKFRDKPFRPDDSAKKTWTMKQRVNQLKYYAKVLSYRRQLPDLRQWVWYPLKDKLLRNSSRFEFPRNNDKYVFFPLQTQPEASTSVRAKWFVNQLDLIEKIAKSLPCDYKLYVKEHRRNYSKRPSGFHKEIKKYPKETFS